MRDELDFPRLASSPVTKLLKGLQQGDLVNATEMTDRIALYDKDPQKAEQALDRNIQQLGPSKRTLSALRIDEVSVPKIEEGYSPHPGCCPRS